jgi:hypothetical protein
MTSRPLFPCRRLVKVKENLKLSASGSASTMGNRVMQRDGQLGDMDYLPDYEQSCVPY